MLRKAQAKQHNYGAYLAELGPAMERDGAPRKSRTLTCLLGALETEEAAGLTALDLPLAFDGMVSGAGEATMRVEAKESTGLTARCFPLDVDGVVSVAEEAARRGRQISGGTLSPIPRAS